MYYDIPMWPLSNTFEKQMTQLLQFPELGVSVEKLSEGIGMLVIFLWATASGLYHCLNSNSQIFIYF